MRKVYIGIDAHKESNVVALAFAGREEPEIYGKVSADLRVFEAALRRILKKYNLSKEDVALCYEAGPTGFVLVRRLIKLDFGRLTARCIWGSVRCLFRLNGGFFR